MGEGEYTSKNKFFFTVSNIDRGERTQTGQKTYFDYICQNND